MNNLERLASFLSSHARRTGKTTGLAELAKRLGGCVLTRTHDEAMRVKKEHGCDAYPYTKEFAGMRLGPTFCEPETVSSIIFDLTEEITELERKLEITVGALEELNIPYSAHQPIWTSPANMPRFPDVIIREALASIQAAPTNPVDETK